MIKTITVVLVLVLLTSPLSADQTPATKRYADRHWEFAGWEGGGCYPNLAFDPGNENRVYLTSDVAGIWRSDDLGETWHFVNRGLGNLNVSVIAVAPSDPNTLYAGTADGVFFSRNAGETWESTDDPGGRLRFSRPESHRTLAISQTNPAKVIAASSKGEVFYSEDFGKKWKVLGDRRPFGVRSPITALTWLKDEKMLYASSQRGFARFHFENSVWEFFRDSPKDISDFWMSPSQSAAMIYAAGQNKLFVSHDSGNSWTSGSAIPQGVLYRLLVPDAGTKVILAAWNDGWKGGVVRSEDEGRHWKRWDKRMDKDVRSDPTRLWAGVHGRINAFKADPFHPKTLFRTDWWGVWRSDDEGVNWAEKIKGAPNTVTSDIQVSDEGDVYVATMDNGLLRSPDGGKSYQTLFPAKGYADDVNGHVWRVQLSGEKILATSSPWGTDVNQVIFSSNRGASFQKFRQGLPAKRPILNTLWEKGLARAFAVNPARPNTVYLGIDGDDGGGFFISDDAGASWRRSKGQPGSFRIYNALAVDPEKPERILWGVTGKGGGIYISENGGENWRRAVMPFVDVFDLAFSTVGGRVYAAGGDKKGPALYGSDDGGLRWREFQRFEGSGSVDALCVLPDGRVAAGVTRWNQKAPGRVYLSSADGKSWENINGDLPEGEGPAAMAYDKKNNTLYLARYAGSVYKTQV